MSYTISKETFQPGGLCYSIAVPDDVDRSEPAQLVLGLHYAGHQGNPFYSAGFLEGLLLPALSETSSILLAPDCMERDWLIPQSANNVFTVLDHIEQQYQATPGQTLLIGYSMGGVGAWHLAAQYQHRFRGVIPVATMPPKATLDYDWEIPVYAIQSRRDELFDLERTENTIKTLQERGATALLDVIESFTHYEVGRYAPFIKTAFDWIAAQ